MGQDKSKRPQPPPQSPSDRMFDNIFEFKMMSKQMAKEAKRQETQHKNLIKKVKDCIAKGDYEQAKVAASDAIRAKNQTKRYQVISSKVETVAQRLQAAYQNQKLTENMQNLTEKMMGAANAMDMVKMNEAMAGFEKMFDDLDVNSAMMDQVFDNVNAGTVNDMEVNTLISQVAEQNGLKVSEEFEGQQVGTGALPGQQEVNGPMAMGMGGDGFPRM